MRGLRGRAARKRAVKLIQIYHGPKPKSHPSVKAALAGLVKRPTPLKGGDS